jgi:hypothetical protein
VIVRIGNTSLADQYRSEATTRPSGKDDTVELGVGYDPAGPQTVFRWRREVQKEFAERAGWMLPPTATRSEERP